MILECPNCKAKYDIPDSTLSKGGRQVRCSECRFKWYQEAMFTGNFDDDDNDILDDVIEEETAPLETPEDIDVQANLDAIRGEIEAPDEPAVVEAPAEPELEPSIPESVKPDHSKNPVVEKNVPKSTKGRLVSYTTAIVTFLLLTFASFIIFSGPILNMWPGSLRIYEMMGAPITVAGEGLVIQELTAENRQNNEGEPVLVLSGRIVNMTEQMIGVPNMIATLRSADFTDGESWIIPAPVDTVVPNGSFRFKSDHTNVPEGITSVYFTFDLGLGQHKGKAVQVSE